MPSNWSVLFEAQVETSAAIHCQSGCFRRASSIMSAELSSPVISASGHKPASTSVLVPGPHPRSMTRRTGATEMRAARSRPARVRSSENFRYCPAFQVGILCGRERFLERRHGGWESLIGRHAPDRFVERLRAHGTGVADLFERTQEARGVDHARGRGQFALVVDLLVDRNARGRVVEIDRDNIGGTQRQYVVLRIAGVIP